MKTILLIRHAKARSRQRWTRPDIERPLTEDGELQARAIADELEDEPIDAIWTSPAQRCVQTVKPLCAKRGIRAEKKDDLFEGSDIVIPDEEATIAICAHGDNIPNLLEDLGIEGPCPTASIWRLEFAEDDKKPTRARYIAPPKIE